MVRFGSDQHAILLFKGGGDVRVFLSDPSCKECNVQFTTVPLKVYKLDNDINFVLFLKIDFF